MNRSRWTDRSTLPCSIHVVRHGRTVMNAEVRFRGRRDVPLDEIGRQEAIDAARLLAGAGLSAAYTSPLARARAVAEAIARSAELDGCTDEAGLLNVDYGEWEGLTREECAARDPELFALYAGSPEDARCPGGESLGDAADRIVQTLIELGMRHQGESIAAVTHGAMVRLAVLRVAQVPPEDWQFKLQTGSATIFEVLDGELRLPTDIDVTQPDPVKSPFAQTA
jgi:broad specificity phosphatase PhoE